MNTKFTIFFLAMLCIIASQVLPDEIFIENHSFEEPNIGKIIGWDEEDGGAHVTDDNQYIEPAEVPGWESDGTVSDSGVEGLNADGDPDWHHGAASDGDWHGFSLIWWADDSIRNSEVK